MTQTSSSSAASKPEFHPALVVSNIKNHIPIVLEMGERPIWHLGLALPHPCPLSPGSTS